MKGAAPLWTFGTQGALALTTRDTFSATPVVIAAEGNQPQAIAPNGPNQIYSLAMPFYNYLSTGVGICLAPPVWPIYPICFEVDDPSLYHLLLRYVPSKKDLVRQGYPDGSPTSAMVYREVLYSSETKLNKNERLCARCKKTIFVSEDLKYTGEEKCSRHSGCSCSHQPNEWQMLCCHGIFLSERCTEGNSHVWSGLGAGQNGPYNDYALAPKASYSVSSRQRIFGLDCEMSYTVSGMEVVRVGIVDIKGNVVYDSLVLPKNEVLDYNTKYSGISKDDFLTKKAKTFEEVRNDLFSFIKEDTIIIGHALENDLRVLKLIHFCVVDTAILYPHYDPYRRRSLKSIAKEVLNVEIQEWRDQTGHDSVEDAWISLRIVLEKLCKEYNISVIVTK